MQDELQLEYLEPLQIWAKLQEVILRKKEIVVWLEFYKERLEHEKKKLSLYSEKEKILQSALKSRASSDELSELDSWSSKCS